ncbi:uncharacterized protein LOC123399621 [Hordeum vulgare subsp. vulgare]|uniref:Predicted protein n=1 Tax=Hordeum vulgare subsp. vulgare TaxID=112509 RepID=F2DDB9_HORVV|nr:uncharacterized protein LOC123399621 [Hordeum vulgare subsp. vulgare]BAJ93090.1 predicted protein [Hordeum vulgare subsp. vulgare]BAJ93984.1 predicted protein [Hordeum vulgare subsp. vulgare]BAJ97526.1 predicted protein [Hordeum vulgare subsp. vulgare]BAK01697.1 predicted protein [Hordeum vulgare subsp. vulgare]
MSTAVAEAFQSYGGFPGSGRTKGDALLGKKMSDGFFIEEEEEDEAEEVLTESSSIGAPSPSSSSIGEDSSSEVGGDGEDDEVESKLKEEPGLGCLDALEDSLPIKNGLSSFYAGKSKSFTSLAEAAARDAVKELAKPENPFNKRRRILATWSRRASCSSLATATYLPPLLAPDHALPEGDEGEEDDDSDSGSDEQHRGKNGWEAPALPPPRLSVNTQTGAAAAARRGGSFRSPRSYSLSDLRNGGDASYNQ